MSSSQSDSEGRLDFRDDDDDVRMEEEEEFREEDDDVEPYVGLWVGTPLAPGRR